MDLIMDMNGSICRHLDEAIVEEEAKDGGGHSSLLVDSLAHGVSHEGLKIRASAGIESWRKLGAAVAAGKKRNQGQCGQEVGNSIYVRHGYIYIYMSLIK